MLLSVSALWDSQLECWTTGGKRYVVDPPTLPYFYNRKPRGQKCETVRRRLLTSPDEEITMFKVLVSSLRKFRDISVGGLENDVRFVERLAIDYGFKHPEGSYPKILAFDCEMSSSGQFPRAERDPVCALAVCSHSVQKCFTGDERGILESFVEVVRHVDPDILATYSGTALDYEYPLARAHNLGLRLSLGRLDDEPYVKVHVYESGKKKGVDKKTYLKGRVCLDVFEEVEFDAYFQGIRHDLKTVSRRMFGDQFVTEVDRSRISDLSDDDLANYCFRDARLTYLLAEHYTRILVELARLLNVPLDFIVYRSPSHIGNVLFGRRMSELGIVSDGANVDRFKGVLW